MIYSFWSGQPSSRAILVPSAPNYNLGIAFTSGVAGVVTGLQFYQSAGDTGPHVGTLWREADQAQLGTVLFSGETGLGWQVAAFATPVPITAGTRYRAVVSHTAQWSYILSTPSWGAGPLVMDAGGVYVAALTGYPATANAENYLVDVVADLAVSAYSFWDPSFVPPGVTGVSGPVNVAMAFTVAAPMVCSGLRFWKVGLDTGSHLATLYREADQALLAGPVLVTGETASGWQTAALGAAVPLTAGTRYRACLTHPVQCSAWTPFPWMMPELRAGPLTMDSTSYYLAGTTANYPNGGSNANHSFVLDVVTAPVSAPTWRRQPVSSQAP